MVAFIFDESPRWSSREPTGKQSAESVLIAEVASEAVQRAYQPVRCRDVGWSGFFCTLLKGAGHGGEDFAAVIAGHQVAAGAEVRVAVGEAGRQLAGGG